MDKLDMERALGAEGYPFVAGVDEGDAAHGTQSAGVIEGSVIEGKGGSIEPLTMGEPIGGIRGWSGLGELFTMLQEKYFAIIFLCVLLFVPLAFFGHYKIIGARKYNHHNKLQVFSKYNIIVHWFAALPFVLICITGLMMIFYKRMQPFIKADPAALCLIWTDGLSA